MNIHELEKLFVERYGSAPQPIHCFFSPGRVNLIGEYTDFNGGYVFPGALSLGIYGVIRYRPDQIIHLQSFNMPQEVTIDLAQPIEYVEKDSWGNYPKGMIQHVLQSGHNVRGCDILYYADLPGNAGLSSSAAMLVLTGYMFLYDTQGDSIDKVQLAKDAQQVENQFIHVNCGIMDQFSVAMGQEDQAILLDCTTLTYRYIPLELGAYSLVIMNTHKKRELTDSKYNERRQECDDALALIKQHKEIENLCQATLDDIEKYITNEVILRRARHTVSENNRVVAAVALLLAGDLAGFGQLLIASHMSLKNDYEVTGDELDCIVFESLRHPACIGARMTGAGFGGCAIALVEKEQLENFKQQVQLAYTAHTGLVPAFYSSALGSGVKKLV